MKRLIFVLVAVAICKCSGQTSVTSIPATLKTTSAVTATTFNPGILPTTPKAKCLATPGVVQNLIVSANDEYTDITWDPPSSFDGCKYLKYHLTVDGALITTEETSYRVQQSLHDADVRVRTVLGNDKGKETSPIMPGPVQNLVSSQTSTTITVDWGAPENVSYVPTYQLWIINSDVGARYETEFLTYTFSKLLACTDYTIDVAAVNPHVGPGERSTIQIKTDVYLPIGSVQNLMITRTGDILNVTWNPPLDSGPCITKYEITFWDQNGLTVTVKVTETYKEFSPIIACMEYNVQVKPQVSSASEGNVEFAKHNAAAKASNPPLYKTETISTTLVIIEWTVDDCAINMCEVTKIVVNCYSPDEHDWVVKNVTVELPITGNKCDHIKRPNILVPIEGLSEFTNYICTAVVTNTGGASDPSLPVEFQTLPAVTSEPLNVATSNIASTNFVVSWEEPYKVPGILDKYRVTILAKGALHFIPEDCSEEVDITYSYEVPAVVTNLYFTKALPDYSYSISVEAHNTAGYGPASAPITTDTLSDVPETVRNETLIIENDINEDLEYNVTAILDWLYPCNTNGKLLEFLVYIYAEPLPGIIGDAYIYNDSIGVNNTADILNYTFVITEIIAVYNYSIKIVASGEKYSSEVVEIVFESPEGYPGSPILHDLADITINSFNVEWEPPLVINGDLVNYNLTIEAINPYYFVPPECIQPDDITILTPEDVTTYEFTIGRSCYKYGVYVQAATGAGFGVKSVKKYVVTLESTSEPPRNLDHIVDDQQTQTDYLVTVKLTWLLPCETKGDLKHFKVQIHGVSLLDGSLYDNEITVPQNMPFVVVEYSLFLDDILPYHSYTMTVTTVAGDAAREGEPDELNFISPEGYPGPPILGEITEVTSGSFNVVWDEPLMKNGQLIYYNVTIVSQGAQHFVPEGCEVSTGTEVIQIPGDVLSYKFINVEADHKYEVYIQAGTNRGFGVASEVKMTTTLESTSEIPRAISYTLEDQQTETNYNLEVALTWELPCDTRGDLLFFHLAIQAVSLLDDTSVHDQRVVLPNDPLTNTTYSALLDLPLPFHSYTIRIGAVTSKGKGDSIPINFDSSQGYPSAPIMGNIIVGSTVITIEWEEPTSINGILESYQLTIHSQGPVYEVPNGCDINTDRHEFELLPNETIYFFTSARPKHSYEIYLRASTGKGLGPPSETRQVFTQTSAPEGVTNVTVNVTSSNEEIYDAEAKITFEQPCNMFGVFQYYQLDLVGTRLNYEDHVEMNRTQGFEFVCLLRPEYNYVATIRAVTETDQGLEHAETFKAPSGIPPPLENDEITPVANSDTTASITLSSHWFDAVNGDLLYYAIILGQQGYEEGSSYAIWNNTESDWPYVGNWTSDGDYVKPYQATPKLWNPFLDMEKHDHPYSLGVEVCSNGQDFCNGALRATTTYAFKLRVFTEIGYRDSKTVYFTTLEPVVAADLGVILGATFGGIGAALLGGGIYFLWRRRMNQSSSKEFVMY